MVNWSGNSSTIGGEEVVCARGKAELLLKPLSASACLSTQDLMYRREEERQHLSFCDSHHLCGFLGENWVRQNGKEVLFRVAYG